MEIEQKDKSAPAHSIEFVEQKDRYIAKLEAENKALRRGLGLARLWLRDDYSPSDNKSYFMDLKTIDQLLTKNEGL